jgi:hypothetical protein
MYVSAEKLNYKLLPTQACDFTLCDEKHLGRTLARTMCSGEETNAIVR